MKNGIDGIVAGMLMVGKEGIVVGMLGINAGKGGNVTFGIVVGIVGSVGRGVAGNGGNVHLGVLALQAMLEYLVVLALKFVAGDELRNSHLPPKVKKMQPKSGLSSA